MKRFTLRRLSLASLLALTVFLVATTAASAATTVTGPGGEWSTGDTRPGGAVAFVSGPASPPLGVGSLQMTSDGPTAKAQFVTNAFVGSSLDDLGTISYWDYRSSASTTIPVQRISLNVPVFLNGTDGFTTLVFEPVYQPGASLSSDTWQQWVASGSGLWWSTRTVGPFCGGAIIACMRTWDDIKATFPNAVVVDSLGFNIGCRLGRDVLGQRRRAGGRRRDVRLRAGADPALEGRVQERRLADVQLAQLQEPGRVRELREPRLIAATRRGGAGCPSAFRPPADG